MKRHLAVVTGGAHRLGKAFCISLAHQGFAIGLHYHHSAQEAYQLKKEIEALHVPVYLLRADLTRPEKINQLFEIIREFDEPLKVLVNSAAVMPVGRVSDLPLDDWNDALDLNLRAPFLLAQQAAKIMVDGGLIVNVSDIGARKAWSRFPSYIVSKSGLESLTRILARALAPSIRVNAIAPGLVLKSDTVTPEDWDTLVNRIPLKRAALPDEIASALEFLLHNEYITGQIIAVDGGYSLI
jgi:pteridine reductase